MLRQTRSAGISSRLDAGLMERGLRLKFANAFWAAGLAAGIALVSVLAGWPAFVAAGFSCLAAGLVAGVFWQTQTGQKETARVETHFGANPSIDDLGSVVALIELPAIALDDLKASLRQRNKNLPSV